MNNKYFLILCIIFSSILSSCSSYYFTFDTFLKNSPSQQLKYEDSLFIFEFRPSFDGIYFQITNLTESSAFLLWDNCYIILPDGNSAKALNIDLLNLSSEVLIKVKNESIIPPLSNFYRFTTADINVDKDKILFLLQRTTTSNFFNISSTITTFDYYSLNSIDYFNYWPTLLPEDISLKKYLPLLRDFVLNKDNLALGFSIRLDSLLINYRFDFKFKKINVFEIPSPWVTAPTRKILEASLDDNWVWKEIDE